MASFRKLVASFLFSSTAAVAQMPHEEPPRIDIAVLLNLDPTRAEQVHAILKVSRQRMETARREIGRPTDETSRSVLRAAMDAIRTETDNQLAAVLSAEELEKLRAAMPRRRPRQGAEG